MTREQAVVTGVTWDESEAKITVTGLPDVPGSVARVFRVLADAKVGIGMVATSRSSDLTCTVPVEDGPVAVAALTDSKADVGFDRVTCDEDVGTVSVIGFGLRTHPGPAATFCETLAAAGLSFGVMSVSEARISLLCGDFELPDAVLALRRAFHLGEARWTPISDVILLGTAAAG